MIDRSGVYHRGTQTLDSDGVFTVDAIDGEANFFQVIAPLMTSYNEIAIQHIQQLNRQLKSKTQMLYILFNGNC